MISISLNGCTEEVVEGISIVNYLSKRSINPLHVVVEVNKVIIQKEHYDSVVINEGDQVEILRFVGGG